MPASAAAPATFLLYAACAFASSFSLRLVDPLVIPIATDFAISASMVALLSSTYAIPYALSQPFLGPLGDRYGRARWIQICMTGLAAVLVVGSLAPDFGWLAASRLAAGVFAGGLVPLVLASLGDEYGLESRQVAIGRMLFAMIGGQMLGSIVAGSVGGWLGWRVAFAIAAALAVLAAAMAWYGLPAATNAGATPRASLRSLYAAVFANPRSKWLFAVVFVEAALFFGAFPHVGSTLAARAGVAADDVSLRVGTVLGAFGVGGLLYALLVRHLIDALGVRRLCRAGSLLGALAYLAMASSGRWWVAAAAMLAAGLAFYMMHNCLQTEATDLTTEARGSAVALFAAALFLGQGAGPIAFGLAAAVAPVALVFLAIAVAIVILGQWAVMHALGSERSDMVTSAAV